MAEQIILFDTTLRDGEQALQTSLDVKNKLRIALALERLGINIIEAGFPISSPGDFDAVQTIARSVKNSRVCALARCVEKDIDAAWQALRCASAFRIHTFIATSPIHIATKLKSTLPTVIERAVHMVKYARRYTDDVEFSCEDAGRTPADDLCRVVEAAISAGATTINIPDTVGYTLPWEFAELIRSLRQRVPNIDKAILSVHTHDDLGLATANTLAAIHAGARQVEGTLNGLGERAGNSALEEVIMAIKTRQDLLNCYTTIQHQQIYATSQIVSQICNMPIPANKAIIGENAFSHSSGIHQDGVLKNRANYEVITPDDIGMHKVALNLTPRSGHAAIKHHMQAMGYAESDYCLDKLYEAFLRLADKKGQIFDYDLEALAFINNQLADEDHFSVTDFTVQSGRLQGANAAITLRCGSELQQATGEGHGPIEALYQAIEALNPFASELIKFHISAKGQGKDALGQVDIVVRYGTRQFHGVGLATDITAASVDAMINAMNHLWRAEQVAKSRQRAQTDNQVGTTS